MTRKILWPVLCVCVPLAIIVGYLLATPDDFITFGIMGLVLLCLCIPFVLRWNHDFLILTWNATVVLFFLPGRPYLWMLISCVTLFVAVLRRAIFAESRSYQVPSVTWPLLFLAGVVFLTAFFTGGMGIRAFGSDKYGGKGYFYILGAVIGYFALTSQVVPAERARFYVVLFFLSGITAVVSNLAYVAGPGFYFLYNFFPPEFAADQAMVVEGFSNSAILRITGLTFGCIAVFTALIAHGSLREILNIRKPWKLILLVLTVVTSLFGGYRSVLIQFALIFTLMFIFERLHRTSLFPKLLIACLIGAVVVIPFLHRMPFSIQRAFSFLPVKVDPIARQDAEASTQWRLEMWKLLLPQVPQYFWKGKGYSIDPNQLYMAEQMAYSGGGSTIDVAILSGNYHNGLFSILIPFGIFGLIGFVWFLWAGFRLLYYNYLYGDPVLKHLNTFLLAYFLARAILFFFLLGSISSDLYLFVGIIGLGISLNGGMAKPAPKIEVETAPLFKFNSRLRQSESISSGAHQNV